MKISRKSRAARTLFAATLALGLGLGTGAATISPATAAASAFVATPNGMVGMNQQVLIFAPTLRNQAVTIGFALGSAGSSQQTMIGANGYGSMNWTPNLPGVWTISGLGSALSVGSTNINVAAMATTTQLFSPNTATSNTTYPVTVVVSAQNGSIAPDGTVSLASGFGVPIDTLGLTPIAGSSRSIASFTWRPQILGNFPLVATYNPASGATTGSVSPTANALISSNAGTVVLGLPTSFRVGQSTTIAAVVPQPVISGVAQPFVTGSASFARNNGYLAGSTTLVNGVASVQWTPTQAGPQVLTTSFTSTTTPVITGVATQAVNVLAPLPTDVLTVSAPNGVWGPGRPNVVTQNQSLMISATAASGTQVLLSETGPCVIAGSVITGLGAGTCEVTATSVGTSAYAGTTVDFVVTVEAPAKKKKR